ncbi:MAG: hypothetical protein Alpg2KO_30080 [Alphaproteobacteria bacterium]
MSRNDRIITGTNVTQAEAGEFLRGQARLMRNLVEKGKTRGVSQKDMTPKHHNGVALRFLGKGLKATWSSAFGKHGPSDELLKDASRLLDEIVENYRGSIGDWACELALPGNLKTARMAEVARAMTSDSTAKLIDRTVEPKGPKM